MKNEGAEHAHGYRENPRQKGVRRTPVAGGKDKGDRERLKIK
jgi:hypothetical protein